MKGWSFALLAGLLAMPGVARSQDTLTIKLKTLAPDASIQIERTETIKSTTVVVDSKGQKLRDATKTTVESSIFKETIVERDGHKPATKLQREYTKAQLTADGVTKILPYQGKTLVIERKGDKYTFTIKGGTGLPATDAALLEREFNRHKEGKTEYQQSGGVGLNRIKVVRNHHPTVKPIDLCRYLATLILPPDSVKPRRLLVPFAGSGSEMIGAIRAGWDEVVGIEQDAAYCELSEGRITGDAPLFNSVHA